MLVVTFQTLDPQISQPAGSSNPLMIMSNSEHLS